MTDKELYLKHVLVHVENLPGLGSVSVESPHMPGWSSGEALCVIPLGQVLPVRNVQTADVNALTRSLNATAL